MRRATVAIALVACATLSAACGSSGLPTTPTPAESLTISGPTALTPGLTTQLTVASNTSSPVTAVMWTAKDPTVATVSSTGLVTAVAPGATLITATAGGHFGLTQIVVQPASTGTSVLTACGNVVTPGHYVLGNDLVVHGTPCLNVSSVASVQIDCAGHATGDIFVNNASSVTISNCTITDGQPVLLTTVRDVTVDHCVLTSLGSVGMRVLSGWNVSFVQDTVTTTQNQTAASIAFSGGGNNRVIDSILTGAYDGGEDRTGTDDGVVIQNEANDTIRGNTISLMFDMGVEGVAAMGNTLIADNTFTGLGISGVGSIYCTSWTSNVIRHNVVSRTPTLAFIGYQMNGICGPVQLPGVLVNNQFVDNVFSNPVQGGFMGPSSTSMSVDVPGTVTGNLVQGNDFGPNECPDLNPPSGFIYGDGNICGGTNPAGKIGREKR